MHKTSTVRLCLLLIFLLAHSTGFGQAAFWQRANRPSAQMTAGPATQYLTVLTNLPGLRAHLSNENAAARGGERSVSLPLPDGGFAEVILESTSVLTPEMQAAHPEIQTFKGTSADGRFSARLTVSPYGATARINTPEGLVYVQPITQGTPEWSAVFFARDVQQPVGAQCLVQEESEDEPVTAGKTTAFFSYGDDNLRTYTLAVATTGEYAVWATGSAPASQAAAIAQITTTVNNVNAIYERDLGVTFTLTSPNGILLTDSTTDPFSRVLSGTTLTSCDSLIDAVVGVGNYDLGHVFGAQWSGGLAQLSSVCGSSKGRAGSGLDPAIFTTTGPSGPVFDATVAHEIGHQFAATHSFAANNGGCSGNTNAATGWEPGGGSTIMAYAGTCNPNYYQFYSDHYFHGGNLYQMGNFMQGTGNSCATRTQPANAAPTFATSALSFTIPHSTPFRLAGSSTDGNNSGLTYTYEQVDAVGTATSSAPSATSTTGPLFRSFPPSTSSTRYLPNLSSQFTGASTPYEVLPSVSRTMYFRATVRDNNAGFGRTAAETIEVNTAGCGPFAITSQSTASSFTANGANTMTVTWNTADACVTCPNVSLRFTRDRGATFTTILESTANDGSETITVPNLPTCDGRLFLECSTIPFFDVNSAAVTIASSCAANGATITPATELLAPTAGDPALNQSLAPQFGTAYSSPISGGSITGTDGQGTLAVFNSTNSSCINFGGNATRYDTYTIYPGTTGSYTFNATGSTAGLVYNIYEGAYSSASPCTGFLASSGTYNGSSVSLANTVSASLCRDKQYTLVVTSFSAAQPTLPAPYSIAFSGGTLSNGTPDPGLNYGFVIVNTISGNVVSIQSTANMTNSVTFPTGIYSIYGISTGTAISSLNTTYANTSFATFNTAVLNQTAGLCASLSSNARSVTVNPIAMPLADVRLDAVLTGRRSSRASWTAIGSENSVRRYELERSYDGKIFELASVVAASGLSRYIVTEASLQEGASGVYYRVGARQLNGETRYSKTVFLPFEGPATPALVVAPNPVQSGVLRAQLGASAAGRGTATVLDATGRVVLTAPLNLSAGTQSIELPVSGLSAGVYLLRVDGAGVLLQSRFVKGK